MVMSGIRKCVFLNLREEVSSSLESACAALDFFSSCAQDSKYPRGKEGKDRKMHK